MKHVLCQFLRHDILRHLILQKTWTYIFLFAKVHVFVNQHIQFLILFPMTTYPLRLDL